MKSTIPCARWPIFLPTAFRGGFADENYSKKGISGAIIPMIETAGRKRASQLIFWVFGLALCMMRTFGDAQPCFAFERIETGETIVYDIEKLKITVGEARLVYNGLVEINNSKALSLTVTATGFKFFDKEQIYLDPETFHPLLIKRNLDIFGKKEDIIEYYDAQKGKVRIVKKAGGKTTQEVIENGGRFDNIYGYIYRQRLLGRFSPNDTYDLHLPTRDVRLKLKETEIGRATRLNSSHTSISSSLFLFLK